MNVSQEGERIDTKSWLAVIIALVVIMSVAMCVILWFPRYHCDRDPVDYVNLRIEANEDVGYEMCLPIPINASGQPRYLVDSLQRIDGNAAWSIVTTPHGIALRIIGSGNLTLQAVADGSKYAYSGFSPVNRTGIGLEGAYAEFFVYANASGLEDELGLYVGAGTATPEGNPMTTVVQAPIGSVREGWQLVIGHTSIEFC